MNTQTDEKSPDELCAEGYNHLKAGDFEKALNSFSKSAELYAQNLDIKKQATQLLTISEIYRRTNKIDDAIKICEGLLKIYKQLEEDEPMLRVLNNMGLLETTKKNHENALDHFKSALEIAIKLDNMQYTAFQLSNIGSTYRDMNSSQQALKYYEKALPLYEELGHKEGIADQYTNMAYVHIIEDRLEYALELYKKGLPIYMEIKNTNKAQFTKQNIKRLEAQVNG